MKTILIYSGGPDSPSSFTTSSTKVRSSALAVDYGQRHACELIKPPLSVPPAKSPSNAPIFPPSDPCSREQPYLRRYSVAEGHYTETRMKSTVVPNRNMLLLALPPATPAPRGRSRLRRPPRRPRHLSRLPPRICRCHGERDRTCDWESVRLSRPFVDWTKADIARRGAELKVPFERTCPAKAARPLWALRHLY